MYLTKEMLIEKRTRRDQVDLFAATFPDGMQVTEAVCIAVAGQFDLTLAAEHFLPEEHRAEYWAKHAALFGRIAETV